MKKLWIVPLVAGLSVSPAVLAAASNSATTTTTTTSAAPDASVQKPASSTKGASAAPGTQSSATKATSSGGTQGEIRDLKRRVTELESWADVNQTRNFTIGTNLEFGVGSGTYADELYIIDFGLNRDLSLLHQRQYIHTKYKRFEDEPHLLITGNIQGTVGKNSSLFGVDVGTHEQFMQGAAEIDFTAMINEDWVGYLEFDGNAFGDNTSLRVIQAFTTFGNFDKYPAYLTLGYQYVPFGNFTTNFIASTQVQNMGRIQVPAANGAFNLFAKENWEINGGVFWFDGLTKASDYFRLDEVGANLQARKTKLGPQRNMTLMFGASVVNNLASSNGLAYGVDKYDISKLDHYVPAADGRFKFTVGDFALTAEYLAAYRSFDTSDFAQGSVGKTLDGARPTSTYVEAAYDFKVWGMPNTISARYDQTTDALAFGLPSEEYGLSYQLKPFFNTRVTFEYMHKLDYSESTMVLANGTSVFGTGDTDDLFQAQINVFF
jgi:hypothetical protein